ncbi:MAG: DUF4380 domain-containing protein [Bacteroidales bacterium]|nr:DUF4380 domain-containing protein [Bacteroidales bacterium]
MSCNSEQKNQATKTSIQQLSEAKYKISLGNLSVQIDKNAGGRIVSFMLGDRELLTGKDVHPENYGSTFWSSPQDEWDWPPPAILDNAPYKVLNTKKSLVLLSETDPGLELQFQKEYYFDETDSSLVINYSIINKKNMARPSAPWEVTRVPGQLSFFPIGENKIHNNSNLDSINIIDGVLWYIHVADSVSKNQKLFAESTEGWLAHVQGRLLFIKKFENIPAKDIAPGEGEVEIYASPEFPYIEIENQGRQEMLEPDDTLHWQVKWHICELPENIKPVAGNKELTEYAKKVLGQ